VDVIAILIDLGCNINKTDKNGWTALHLAAFMGHVDVVAKLIDLGCDMNKTANNGLMEEHHFMLQLTQVMWMLWLNSSA
jgi:ankyrin repeat protein